MVATLEPRRLRPAPEPLGNFIRPGYNDHTVVAQALAEGRGIGTGLVIDPVLLGRQAPLLSEARAVGVERVLDSKSLELSTAAGYAMRGVADLPWAAEEIHSPLTLGGAEGKRLVSCLSEYAAEAQVSGVLAPTHLLEGLSSPWWLIDAALTRDLRRMLNELEMTETLIYYPITLRAVHLADPAVLERLVQHLSALPIDGLWLRIHPFGTTNSGPLMLKRYLNFCRKLHTLGLPLVAEHSGNVGVALLAFGAVGGIESGVTFKDTVNLDSILRTPKDDQKGFLPAPRVYLHQLGAFIDPGVARGLLEKRGMKTLHSCQVGECCPRGWIDMVSSPRQHFLRQRSREVAKLSAMPSSLRAGFYMENFLRPASDRAVRTAELEPSIQRIRKRLDSWRGTLGADLEVHHDASVSRPASGRRLRGPMGAAGGKGL